MIFVSACISLLPFKVIPYEFIIGIADELYNQWYYSLVGLLFLVVSIMLLLSGISTSRRVSRGVVKSAEFGDIKISVGTFEALAYRVVKQLSGIKEVKISELLIYKKVFKRKQLLYLIYHFNGLSPVFFLFSPLTY
jgi:hypothetical protein